MLCITFGHTLKPAFLTSLPNAVPRPTAFHPFLLAATFARKRSPIPLTTYTDPVPAARSKASSRNGWRSGKTGTRRDSPPVWCSVFGLRTVIMPLTRSTSDQRSDKTSDGARSPAKRLSAAISCQSGWQWSATASMTSRGT